MSELLDAKGVAEIFGLHHEVVLKMAREGRLPAVRINRKTVRFRRADIERFITEHLNLAEVSP